MCCLNILGRKWFIGTDVLARFAQQLTVELVKLLLVNPEVRIRIHALAKDCGVVALLALQELEVPLRELKAVRVLQICACLVNAKSMLQDNSAALHPRLVSGASRGNLAQFNKIEFVGRVIQVVSRLMSMQI